VTDNSTDLTLPFLVGARCRPLLKAPVVINFIDEAFCITGIEAGAGVLIIGIIGVLIFISPVSTIDLFLTI
jgi:hypothetical protein